MGYRSARPHQNATPMPRAYEGQDELETGHVCHACGVDDIGIYPDFPEIEVGERRFADGDIKSHLKRTAPASHTDRRTPVPRPKQQPMPPTTAPSSFESPKSLLSTLQKSVSHSVGPGYRFKPMHAFDRIREC